MPTRDVDAVVIGAGMAGASAAAHLSQNRLVALIEAEEAPGYHTTGRSAALWVLNYGPPDVRALSAASRDFFEAPPPGFTEAPLLRRRAVLFVATAAQGAEMAAFRAEAEGATPIEPAEAARLVPALRPGYAAEAALEADAFDMDVAALQAGFLRQLRVAGGHLALRHRSQRIAREGDAWLVETTMGPFAAPVVIDAAGAWGDEVAAQAGVAPLGLVPKRRTAAVIDPGPWTVTDWPTVIDVGSTWYVRPEARTRLMVSPADETPTHPHDVQPEELDVAVAIDRMQQALDIEVRRVERSWAGLRTFTPDGSLAFGWAEDAAGFFWCVGQGGYGIQTAPAAGRLVAALVAGRDPEAGLTPILGRIDPRRFKSPRAHSQL